MPTKKPRQYKGGAKGRKPSAALMGALDLSPGQHLLDDIAAETTAVPETRKGENPPPNNKLDRIGAGWSSSGPHDDEEPSVLDGVNVIGDLLDGSPERGLKEAAVSDTLEEQETLGFDWDPRLGDELDDMDIDQEFDALQPDQPNTKSSSPHTLLERSLRAAHGQSNHHSEQSQRTVGFIGDDFEVSESDIDEEEGAAAASHITKSGKATSDNQEHEGNRKDLINQTGNSRKIQHQKQQDEFDDVSSPEQPSKPRPSVAKYPSSKTTDQQPQPKKTRQVAKKPFDATQPIASPEKPAQSLPSKSTKKAAAGRSKQAGHSGRAAARKAKPSNHDKDDLDKYDMVSDFEEVPKVLGGKTSRKAPQNQVSVPSKASDPKKAAPAASKTKANASAVPNKRKAPGGNGRKRRSDDDEEFTPEKQSDMSTSAPRKRAKRHQMMETSNRKEEPSRVEHPQKMESRPSPREEQVEAEDAGPGNDADEESHDATRNDDEAIIIPSDSSSDSEVPESQQKTSPVPTKKGSTSNSKPHGGSDKIRAGGPKEVAEEHPHGTNVVKEHVLRKPQIISFGPGGPKNLGQRSPRKHDASPMSTGPKKKARTEFKRTLASGAGKPLQEQTDSGRGKFEHAALADGHYFAGEEGHNDTGLIPGSPAASRTVPDKPSFRDTTKRVFPLAQQEASMGSEGCFNQEPKHRLQVAEQVAQPASRMPVSYTYRAPSRRSSRVDETGSPNASRTTFALNGAPSYGGRSGMSQGQPTTDITEKPPPGFCIQDVAETRPTHLSARAIPGHEGRDDTRQAPRLDRSVLPTLKYRDSGILPTDKAVSSKVHLSGPVEHSRRPVSTKFTNSFKEVLRMDEQSSGIDRGGQKTVARTPVSILGDDQARNGLDGGNKSWTLSSATLPQTRQVHDQQKDDRVGVIREDTLGTVVPKIVELMLQRLNEKDASVEKVADMYARNGSKLVDEVEQLHKTDRRDLAAKYEERRSGYVANCEATQKRVQHLREAMEKVSVAHDGSPQRELVQRRYVAVQKAKANLRTWPNNAGKVMIQ